MALNGSLDDLSMVSLLQFPHAGRKTGELTISNSTDTALLYYQEGNLAHAVLRELVGMDALVELLGWSEGEFQFVIGPEAEATTFDMELHRSVMCALKIRDERAGETRTAAEGGDAARKQKEIADFVVQTSFVQHASVIDQDGGAECQANRRRFDTAGIEETQKAVLQMIRSYPRGDLRRVLLDDEESTTVAIPLDQDATLLVITDHGAALGAVLRTVGRLTKSLQGER